MFYGGNYEDALDAALAIEVFHNFSLVHDDIMDAAPSEKREKTVHKNGILILVFCLVTSCLLIPISILKTIRPDLFNRFKMYLVKQPLKFVKGSNMIWILNTSDMLRIPIILK